MWAFSCQMREGTVPRGPFPILGAFLGSGAQRPPGLQAEAPRAGGGLAPAAGTCLTLGSQSEIQPPSHPPCAPDLSHRSYWGGMVDPR